jgi:Ni/Co efflux regulator RcnB
MIRITSQTNRLLAFAIAGMLAAGPAIAEKPPWTGDNKDEKKAHKEKRDKQKDERRDDKEPSSRDRDGYSVRAHEYFEDRHRVVVREYYQEQFRSGRCPPGLAKKHNGCMPPGQLRKWSIGHRLPRDVIFYDVPDALIVQIGRPPAGHRYVRVATDILLIAIGTGMVIDAIQDLGGM